MTETINKNELCELQLIITWQGDWYKIPFYLLDEMFGQPIQETSVPVIKDLLKDRMNEMEAYKMYDHV